MTPFHLIGILALAILAVVITVGDDIVRSVQWLGYWLDPTDRQLMKICERVRRE